MTKMYGESVGLSTSSCVTLSAMAVVAFTKKSIALALAAGSVYASHRSGVWGTADESKKAWNDVKASIATTTNRTNLLPVKGEVPKLISPISLFVLGF